jgi:Arc/MetJ-type ribon-helix-helix transcriptional regulator
MPNQRKPNQIVTSFTIPKHLLKWVHDEAHSRGQSTSEYIRALLLKQWDKKTEAEKENKK